jgi:propionate catabolism operon transcriptional regulator
LSASTVLEILPELARPFPTETTGALKELEASAIMTAMDKFGGDKQRVANHLGISVTTLWRRLKRMEEKDPGKAARH